MIKLLLGIAVLAIVFYSLGTFLLHTAAILTFIFFSIAVFNTIHNKIKIKRRSSLFTHG
jgi:hypothetical protein